MRRTTIRKRRLNARSRAPARRGPAFGPKRVGLLMVVVVVAALVSTRLWDTADVSQGAIAWLPGGAPAETITGRPHISDGDSLRIAGERIRLIGIDAPEGNQTCQADGRSWRCGDEATVALRDMIGGRAVSCEVYGRDRFERALAVCFAGELELNREMVRQGWALAWYPARGAVPGPSYDAEQTAAERAGRGMWRGTFTNPWEWRQQ